MNNTKRVAIVTNNLICETNTKYYSTLEKYFKTNGWDIVGDFNADMVVFATCGFSDYMYLIIVNALADLKELQIPDENIIMMGCLPKTHGANLEKIFKGRFIEFGQEEELDRIIQARIPLDQIIATNVFKSPLTNQESSKEELFNIQICDGCLKQCTFCVVNKAHGDLRSMPVAEIEEQFRKAIRNGYHNINLVGIDVLGYGYDTGTNVVELIEYLLKIEPNVKFYLGSLHARWFKLYWEGLLDLCKRKVIDSLHVVVQHVNDEILRKMGRPIQFSETYNTICRFKQECPELFISTDLIVGFPGETAENFEELCRIIDNDKCFSLINHYSYSDVKGASSYHFDNKISEDTKKYRWEMLNMIIGERSPGIALQNYQSAKYNRYKSVFRSFNPKGYTFCRSTYEDKLE